MILLAKSAGADQTPESLLSHSTEVTRIIGNLFERLPVIGDSDPELRVELETAALLHDIGKAATGFQDWLAGKRNNWNGWRHEVLSAAFAASISISEEVTFAVLTHHKRIPELIPSDSSGTLRFIGSLPADWLPMQTEFQENRAAVDQLWKELCTLFNRPDLIATTPYPLDGAFIDPTWRKPEKQRKLIPFERRKRASLIRGLLISADHLASGHSTLPPTVDLKQFSPKFELRPFQQSAGVEGNLILRAPTGSGKTEAALNWAARNQPINGRLFYTLPYTAALNAMHKRLQSTFPNRAESIGLLHGRATQHLFDAMQCDFPGNPVRATAEALARARLAREMYHPVRVCTPHQLLRFTLRGKGWEQILSEIPGACIVFDEVHSYDPKLAGLTLGTARLFNKLGARLMFISATLPAFLERTIADLMPCISKSPDSNNEEDRAILSRLRHEITVENKSLTEMLPEIVSEANSGLTVLVVCNHVRSAQTIAQLMRVELGDENVCLFHGRFNMRDRSAIEKRLSSASLPRALVATQVVEVSLDISYGRGYFEAAPIDALAQRMGRVNRTGSSPVPILIAAKPINKHPLYDADSTSRTLEQLRNLTRPVTENDLVDICNLVYEGGYKGEDRAAFEEMLNHPYLAKFEESMIAGDHEQWVDKVMEGMENRIDVLPACLRREHQTLMNEHRWLEADRLTVNIYGNESTIAKYVDKSHDPWAINLSYGPDGLAQP